MIAVEGWNIELQEVTCTLRPPMPPAALIEFAAAFAPAVIAVSRSMPGTLYAVTAMVIGEPELVPAAVDDWALLEVAALAELVALAALVLAALVVLLLLPHAAIAATQEAATTAPTRARRIRINMNNSLLWWT
jgi:hypothetical protein